MITQKEIGDTWPKDPFPERHKTIKNPRPSQHKTVTETIWDTQKQFWER